MASAHLKHTSDGRPFYEIHVSRGRGLANLTRRWYVPDGWSEKSIQRELAKVAAELERQVKAGETISRKQKAEAEAAKAAEAAKIRTVRQYADCVFTPAKECSLSRNSAHQYRDFLRLYILPAIGEVQMPEVKPAMITRLLLDFQKTHAHASTIKLYNILNGLFQMAFLDDTIPMNPMLKVKRPAPRKDEKHTDESEKTLSADELRFVLHTIEGDPLKWQVYVRLAADTGARRGELCALQWADIDWQKSAITIRRNLQFGDGQIYACAPKNGKSRRVDIGAETTAMLRQLRQEQAERCMSEWVFSQDSKPDPMHPTSPTHYFRQLAKRTGIPNLHPHILRHTSASLAITNGADVVSVSARLGHSDTAVTLRMYAHANEESIRRAGDIVREIMNEG